MASTKQSTQLANAQDAVLLEFLELAPTWVSNFHLDMTEQFKEAVEREHDSLRFSLEQTKEGMAFKPSPAVQQALSRQIEAVTAAQSKLKRLKLPADKTCVSLVSYEIAAPLAGNGPRRKTTVSLRQADVVLTVRVPHSIKVKSGKAFQLPYALLRTSLPLEPAASKAEIETDEARFKKEIAPVLSDPKCWEFVSLTPEPEISVAHVERQWYFILAPESEGLMASFNRLQQIRAWVSNDLDFELPPQFFGVVSPNIQLRRLAKAQGYAAFESTTPS